MGLELLAKLYSLLSDEYKNVYDRTGAESELITNRLEKEIKHAEKNDQIGVIIIVKELYDYAEQMNLPILLNGSANEALLFYLLGVSKCNPLPPHYLCSSCKYIEWAHELEDGMDLPLKICPECGKVMKCDGHNIPYSGISNTLDPTYDLRFSCVPSFIKLAKEKLRSLSNFKQICLFFENSKNQIEITYKYYLFNENNNDEYKKYYKEKLGGRKNSRVYDDFSYMSIELYPNLDTNYLSFNSLIKDHQSSFDVKKALEEINSGHIEDIPFISNTLIYDYINKVGKVNVGILIKLYSSLISQYTEEFRPENYLIVRKDDIKRYPSDREDVLDILKYYGLDDSDAKNTANIMRKGKDVRNKVDAASVPKANEWILEFSNNVKYLTYRAHSVSRVVFSLQAAYARQLIK